MTPAATVTLEDAARRTWGAVVVGAGPAGATAARELARRSVTVLLVDRAAFPRWKVCGCCLNGRAASVLRRAGLGALTAGCRAVPLECIRLAAGGRHARVPLAGGVALSREAFDAALVRAAVEAGADFLPMTRAILAEAASEKGGKGGVRFVRLRQGDRRAEAEARVVLAADGLAGQFLAHADAASETAPRARVGAGATATDAPDFYRRGVVYMTCGAGGYAGLVRLEDGRLDVAAAFDATRVRADGGPGRAAARLVREAGWPAPELFAELSWRGTPALTRRASAAWPAERVFVLGDAAGYVEPFTGEGMAWALASGVALAPLAVRAVERWRPDLERRWQTLHRRVVTRRQAVCRIAAAVLRRPRLIGLFVRLLACAPTLASPVVRYLNH